MKNTLRRFFVAMLTLIGAAAFVLPACAQATGPSAIAEYLEIYGYTLPQATQETMHAAFAPQTMDCGDVQVSFDEILYDGFWLYTAASAVPTDPEKTLILPGSAQSGDLVSGIYGEGHRGDNRTFLKAAIEDSKRLLAVYVYPKEFDTYSSYFLDHFQLAQDKSVLFSGASMAFQSEPLSITWSVQVYEVDKVTGKYTLENEYEYPAVIAPLKPLQKRQYAPAGDDALPFDAVLLVKSGLTVYVFPEWNQENAENQYEITLQDVNGTTVPGGAPPEMGTFTMDELPDKIFIQLYDRETGGLGTPVLLV